jgi:hypothetical protein
MRQVRKKVEGDGNSEGFEDEGPEVGEGAEEGARRQSGFFLAVGGGKAGKEKETRKGTKGERQKAQQAGDVDAMPGDEMTVDEVTGDPVTRENARGDEGGRHGDGMDVDEV